MAMFLVTLVQENNQIISSYYRIAIIFLRKYLSYAGNDVCLPIKFPFNIFLFGTTALNRIHCRNSISSFWNVFLFAIWIFHFLISTLCTTQTQEKGNEQNENKRCCLHFQFVWHHTPNQFQLRITANRNAWYDNEHNTLQYKQQHISFALGEMWLKFSSWIQIGCTHHMYICKFDLI